MRIILYIDFRRNNSNYRIFVHDTNTSPFGARDKILKIVADTVREKAAEMADESQDSEEPV